MDNPFQEWGMGYNCAQQREQLKKTIEKIDEEFSNNPEQIVRDAEQLNNKLQNKHRLDVKEV